MEKPERVRSDCARGATRVHGGEHLAALLLGGAALLAAQGRPHSADRFQLGVQRLAGLDLAERVKRRVRLLSKLDQLCARQGGELVSDLFGGWDCVLHAPIIPLSVRLSTISGTPFAIFSP